jgi:hypothetical protein
MRGDEVKEGSIVHPRRREVDITKFFRNETEELYYVRMPKFHPYLRLSDENFPRLGESARVSPRL